MNTVVFELKYPADAPDRLKETDLIFKIPLLPAYAIEYTEFSVPDQLNENQKRLIEGKNYFIENNKLIWKYFEPPLFIVDAKYRLTVHHHGIRDYKLLFPYIENDILKQRLGDFYREAEIAFENAAWLSFALTCGAIYEGILFSISQKDSTFNILIKDAGKLGIIDEKESEIMHVVRKLRNLVHGNQYIQPYVSRLQAMDMRTVMNKIIKRDWSGKVIKRS